MRVGGEKLRSRERLERIDQLERMGHGCARDDAGRQEGWGAANGAPVDPVDHSSVVATSPVADDLEEIAKSTGNVTHFFSAAVSEAACGLSVGR